MSVTLCLWVCLSTLSLLSLNTSGVVVSSAAAATVGDEPWGGRPPSPQSLLELLLRQSGERVLPRGWALATLPDLRADSFAPSQYVISMRRQHAK